MVRDAVGVKDRGKHGPLDLQRVAVGVVQLLQAADLIIVQGRLLDNLLDFGVAHGMARAMNRTKKWSRRSRLPGRVKPRLRQCDGRRI